MQKRGRPPKGTTRVEVLASAMERFEDMYVPEPNSGCWLWTHGLHKGTGYGKFRLCMRHMLAHRAAYLLYRGNIPPGLDLDHRCRVKCCVNPQHLEVVAAAENTRRGLSAKLTMEKARAIRADPRPQAVLAKEYGVHQSQISNVKRGRTWAEG